MGFFDEPIQPELADARQRLLHLLQQYCPDFGSPAELLDLADRYLQMNPGDAEVRHIRDRLAASPEALEAARRFAAPGSRT